MMPGRRLRHTLRMVTLIIVVHVVQAGIACAQQRAPRLETVQDSARVQKHELRPVRVAKWGSLLASTAAIVYGFAENRGADRSYADIERYCAEDPGRCVTNPGSSAYADAALEQRYQNVVKRDNRARASLLAGQIGVAVTAVLFLFDLPNSSAPDDIPYDPRPLRFGVIADHIEVGIQLAMH